jgi:hypothetical protein
MGVYVNPGNIGFAEIVTIQHPLNECLRNDETDRIWLVFETHISQYLGLFFKTPAFSGGY